jgi:hypothetical protein
MGFISRGRCLIWTQAPAAIIWKLRFLPAGLPIDLQREKDNGNRRIAMGDKGKKAKDKGRKQQIAKHDQEAKTAKRKQEKRQKRIP